ncbi:MAG: M23 family metallopeptidase [Planctomycetes bacterium]|nr:M23 family metallopeptidase [Planctomycetota bacterium]
MNTRTSLKSMLLTVGALALFATTVLAHEFRYPVAGTITSTYGSSRSYGNHGALDIAGNNGKAIGAARGGRVTFAGWNGGYGKLVIVSHGSGYTSYYAHMSSIAVRVGQAVSTGQTLGYVGTTGNSTGPHCHFEVRKNGVKQSFPPYSTGVWVSKGTRIPKDI